MKNKYYIIFIPLILGIITSFFINNDLNSLVLPPYMPPSYVFGIVWSILYLLMGISLYIVKEDNKAMLIFTIQLFFNLSWSFLFFNFKLYGFSIIWLIILIVLVSIMLITFFQINKKASIINYPYFIWLLIALYLNSSIYVLN